MVIMNNTRRSKKTLLGGCTTRGGKATGTPMEDPKTGQVEKSSANQKVNIVSVRVFRSVQAVTVIKYINSAENIFGGCQKPSKIINKTGRFEAECWSIGQRSGDFGGRIQRRSIAQAG